MTLSELLPSLGCEAADHLEPGVWPRSTRLGEDGELLFAGARVSHLAARFGTPSYLIDEQQVRDTAREYRRALPDVEVAYASKALCTRSVLRWVAEEGLSLDTCSAGEIAVARSVGFPAERIHVTGIPVEPRVVERRPGDPAYVVAVVDKIRSELGWQARYDLRDMVESAWTAWVARRGHPVVKS